MTAIAAAATTDRSDVRTVTVGGAKLGALTALGVVVFAALSLALPVGVRGVAQALVVVALGTAVALLPALWVAPRSGDGVAAAAALALCGTVTFTVLDVAVLRPLNGVMTLYPWTWDAIGGGSVWWHLPIWWMLGTLLGWTGALVAATGAARGAPTVLRAALPALVTGIVLGVVGRSVWAGLTLPVALGGGLTVALAAFAVVGLARRG